MRTLTVAEIKTNFSDILGAVQQGEKFEILFEAATEPVAMIVPAQCPKTARKIGILDGKAQFTIHGGSKITENEFLGT